MDELGSISFWSRQFVSFTFWALVLKILMARFSLEQELALPFLCRCLTCTARSKLVPFDIFESHSFKGYSRQCLAHLLSQRNSKAQLIGSPCYLPCLRSLHINHQSLHIQELVHQTTQHWQPSSHLALCCQRSGFLHSGFNTPSSSFAPELFDELQLQRWWWSSSLLLFDPIVMSLLRCWTDSFWGPCWCVLPSSALWSPHCRGSL